MLALDVSEHTAPLGDDRLTCAAGADFTAQTLARSLKSLTWTWDAEREGKCGKAAARFKAAPTKGGPASLL